MLNIKEKLHRFQSNYRNVHQAAKKAGLTGILRLLWQDLFEGRSLGQWLYLLVLSSIPFVLEFTNQASQHDWVGLFASWTGIVCVILVAEGRASNYLFGAINSAIYLILSFEASFYGEVLTTIYFFIMQPIGLYTWLSNRINGQDQAEESHFEAKKLRLFDWVKYLALTALIWIGMGFAYQSIGSHRPFRDSVTDATNGVGQLLMTRLYREQWIFWIATNLFSIYLWWGSNVNIQGMYWVYTINSLVGWYQWTKALKRKD
ncbi:nicotinamide riboside transporter PnuC [Streptococcus massiliensis]|uniref:Nicotinamide mononucleotide transporter n=1 Tax=Streptococcus massiliensis TaxID=313439 RepID=A0A380L0P5_9STRE|nr:nicotinamide riboside transporter PnuC [Streptococcus massiliensis]SUN77129.1 nicotinamide mononucleotide transporter [Streptococcus massiliensis]